MPLSDQSGVVVRIARTTRNTIVGVLSGVMAVFVVSAALSLAGLIDNRLSLEMQLAIVGVALSGGGLSIAAYLRSRVVLTVDEVLVTRFLTRTRRIARTDIIARRAQPAHWRAPGFCVLITRAGTVDLPPYLEHDRVFDDWLKRIPLDRHR